MHPEIEKLIELALADGQVTERERKVILNKAKELDVDVDEVEMIMEGRLHQIEANKPKQKEKVGNIKTCPVCGANVNAMELTCIDCGKDFTNVSANRTTVSFENLINSSRQSYIENGVKAGRSRLVLEVDFEKRELPIIIKNYPIPNSKEDLFEVLSFMSSKVISSEKSENEELNAYHAKALEIITKLHLVPNIDSKVLERVTEIEKKMIKVKSKNSRKSTIETVFLFIATYLLYSFIARLFGYHFWPF